MNREQQKSEAVKNQAGLVGSATGCAARLMELNERKMKLKSVFLPPGVQAKLYERLGTCPRQLPIAAVTQIDALWMRRNQCDESEIDAIDAQMEEIAATAADPKAMAVSHAINAKRARIQGAIDRRTDRE